MQVFFHKNAKWYLLSCIALSISLGFWLLYPDPIAPQSIAAVPLSEPEVHYVTPKQLTDSAALSTKTVSGLAAVTDCGERFTWPRSDEPRPLLLVFIKSGCPCSVEMEPFFHRLHHAYSDVACFAGVIDADVETARKYAQTNETPYPILADPDRQIINETRAENGVYVALIVQANSLQSALSDNSQAAPVIDTLWPGCSTQMFAEMGERIAKTAGIAKRSIDVSGLPSALVTGCPYPPLIP